MIKNERQYEFTKEQAQKFERALSDLHQDEEKKKKDPQGWQLFQDSLQSQYDTLCEEIADYQMLQAHDGRTQLVLKIDNLHNLGLILIKARMAAKLSQKELADMTGITEEQIQQFEAKDYQNASFGDILTVRCALEVKLQKAEFILELDKIDKTPFKPYTRQSASTSSGKEINALSPER